MTQILADHGLLISGPATPTEAVAAATDWCTARGLDAWDIDELGLAGRVRRAWWGGDALGFVGRDHPDAVEVVVVGLPEHLLTLEEP